MRKSIALFVLLALALGIAAGASADQADTHYVFGYVIDMSADGFEIITDNETWYGFTVDDASVIGTLRADDAVLVRYTGDLNVNAQAQSVQVTEVAVLQTMYGRVEDATMNTISVRNVQDDGQLYLFSQEEADMVVGEGGILIGDEIEIAYLGELRIASDQTQQLDYVHIVVFGQSDEEEE